MLEQYILGLVRLGEFNAQIQRVGFATPNLTCISPALHRLSEMAVFDQDLGALHRVQQIACCRPAGSQLATRFLALPATARTLPGEATQIARIEIRLHPAANQNAVE